MKWSVENTVKEAVLKPVEWLRKELQEIVFNPLTNFTVCAREKNTFYVL